MPKFSIIIPVYNVAPYLRECLDSVLAQTFTDWEAICVDDGSSDGSGVILDEYARKDNRIKVVHKVNGGVSSARNAGLSATIGEWVVFLDADDYLGPEYLSGVKIAIADSVDVIGCDVRHVDSEGRLLNTQRQMLVFAEMKGEQALGDVRGPCQPYQTCGWDKVYRRSFLESWHLRFDQDLKLGEDVLFAQLALLYARKFVVCPWAKSYYYRDRRGSATDGLSIERELDGIRKFQKLYRHYQRNKSKSLALSLVSNIMTMIFVPFKGNCNERRRWIETLVGLPEFNCIAMPFLARNGTIKERLFAQIYLLTPKRFKNQLLLSL